MRRVIIILYSGHCCRGTADCSGYLRAISVVCGYCSRPFCSPERAHCLQPSLYRTPIPRWLVFSFEEPALDMLLLGGRRSDAMPCRCCLSMVFLEPEELFIFSRSTRAWGPLRFNHMPFAGYRPGKAAYPVKRRGLCVFVRACWTSSDEGAGRRFRF